MVTIKNVLPVYFTTNISGDRISFKSSGCFFPKGLDRSFLNADKTVLPTRGSEDLLPCQQLCLVAVPAWPASNKTPDLWVLSGFPWAEVLHTCCWILPEEEACSEWPMGMGRRRENVGSLAWIPPDPARYVPLPLPIPVVNYIFLYSLL